MELDSPSAKHVTIRGGVMPRLYLEYEPYQPYFCVRRPKLPDWRKLGRAGPITMLEKRRMLEAEYDLAMEKYNKEAYAIQEILHRPMPMAWYKIRYPTPTSFTEKPRGFWSFLSWIWE